MGVSARPPKRQRLLSDESGSDSEAVSEPAQTGVFNINAEFAQRFEHNKKREEKQRLEEKFGPNGTAKRRWEEEDEEEDKDSTDETEDDDADLVTADVDEEIFSTLQAIKTKDPRVYDVKSKFYKEFDPEAIAKDAKKSDKPMYLQDYHRENLLSGYAGDGEEDSEPVPPTYQEEQDALKRDVVRAMHTAAEESDDADEDETGDGLLVAKSRPKQVPSAKPTTKQITEADIQVADRDPETYLSNFMAARAWLPSEESRFHAFESDDSDEEARAEAVEEAYNLRYEDPKMANEKLKSFSRDVGKYGVRREEKSSRKKIRDREQEKKAAAKQEREDEKMRLRKLRIEEAEDKVKRIKDAAGIRGQDIDLDQWRDIIEGDFDDDRWEQEMKRRFGEAYYAEQDDDAEEDAERQKRGLKKPKWDDDIDIDDLVPDIDGGTKPDFTLSSGEEEDDTAGASSQKKSAAKKDRIREKSDAKRAARKERMKIEEMVDSSLPLDVIAAPPSRGAAIGFRYRATSPTSFGMTARDILFADDAQLNQYAGLKKMAAFRDESKKQRDRKKLSKKARLKQWRKETFGSVEEPSGGFEKILGGELAGVGGEGEKVAGGGGGKEGSKKKRKHRKKAKAV